MRSSRPFARPTERRWSRSSGRREIRWCGPETTSPTVRHSSASRRSTTALTGSRAAAAKSCSTVGDDDFPFPIPLVPDGPRWLWDTDAGDDELLNRRIGENELATIQVCLAYVDAQREYYSRGQGLLEYAQRLDSTKGKHDGLYWETRPGELDSPLGPLVARARAAGYPLPPPRGPAPYHGYFYRILLAQGPDAPGEPMTSSCGGT